MSFQNTRLVSSCCSTICTDKTATFICLLLQRATLFMRSSH